MRLLHSSGASGLLGAVSLSFTPWENVPATEEANQRCQNVLRDVEHVLRHGENLSRSGLLNQSLKSHPDSSSSRRLRSRRLMPPLRLKVPPEVPPAHQKIQPCSSGENSDTCTI